MPTVVMRNQIVMRRRIRWKPKLPRQPNHEAASDTESDQLDWDPEKLMMTVIPWWTKTGTLWYPYHRKDRGR